MNDKELLLERLDRDKVIKGIRKCLSHKPCSENGCPYENECAVEHLNDPLLRDALALLKEQEAVEPTLIREGRNKYYNNFVCPRCDNDVFYEQNYCSECGVRFLWEGR